MNKRNKKDKLNNRLIAYVLGIAGLFSLFLILVGEWEAASALWVTILCTLPAAWLALRTSYLGVKIFCATTLITQSITVPAFYLKADLYTLSDYRPFAFTAMDALPVYLILGLFLWLMVCVVKLTERAFGPPVKLDVVSLGVVMAAAATKPDRLSRNSTFVIGILLLMAISLPIKSWMFDMGIGLVGAPPPELPYRLSGVLFYSFNYLVPVAIGYQYIQTKRNSLLLALIMSLYAVLVGLASVSKGVPLMIIAPIIAFAWLDRRWAILGVSVIFTVLGVTIPVKAREIVLLATEVSSESFTDLGLLGTLAETLDQIFWSPSLLLAFVDIADRFEGFKGMFLASQFNTDAVGSSWDILLKVVSYGFLVELDHDAIHSEYLGHTLPIGFYGVGATLNSWMMMVVNKNILMVLPFAAHAAITLVLLEKTLMRAARKHRLPLRLAQSFLFLAACWFYTGPATLEFAVIFATSVILSFAPVLKVGTNAISAPIHSRKLNYHKDPI